MILVLTDTRNKYDGTRRSPWNEVECGDHYARPMASFLLFEIASGQVDNTGFHSPIVTVAMSDKLKHFIRKRH
jgi:hypothetical protein